MKITENKKLKTFDEVLKKASNSKTFLKAYDEEVVRLRLAGKIRHFRTEMKLTQANVARKAHMPQSVIARVEGGKSSISLDTLNRIAQALGRKVELV